MGINRPVGFHKWHESEQVVSRVACVSSDSDSSKVAMLGVDFVWVRKSCASDANADFTCDAADPEDF